MSHSGKTAAQLGVNVYYCGGSMALGGWIGTNYFTSGHADHLTLYFTAYTSGSTVNSGGNISGSANVISHSTVTNTTKKYIRLYNSVPSADGTKNMSVGSWKLEKGTKATDWTPAPEDVDANVEDINASLVATEKSLSEDIQKTNDDLGGVTDAIEQLNTTVQQDRANMGNWLTFTESEALTIGKANSKFKITMNEKEQAFMYDDKKLAYTSGDSFVAPRMDADELHIGN